MRIKTSVITSTANGLGFRFRRAYKQKNCIKLYDAKHYSVCRCCHRQNIVDVTPRLLKRLEKALGGKYTVSSNKSIEGFVSVYIRTE